MKLNRKKIIAREFLILMSCIGISILAYIGTLPYNYIISSNIKNSEKQIKPLNNQIDSLERAYNTKIEKHKWFFREIVDRYGPDIGYSSYKELWTRLSEFQKSDSIDYKWNNVWSQDVIKITKEIGFKDGKDFNQFIIEYSLNKQEQIDEENANKIRKNVDSLKRQIRYKENRLLDSEGQIYFGLICLIIMAIIAFPVRYLIYSIRWSMKTLKQKE